MIFQNEKKIQAIQTTGFVRQNIHIIPKEVVHGFGPELAIFSTFFFCQYRPAKCVLSYSRTKKRLSWLKKEEVLKFKKWSFFQRGFSIVLVQNWPFCQFFFICNYRPAKCVLSYSRTKKRFSWLKKQKVQKIKQLRFFQRGQSVVQVHNWPYFQHIFLVDKGQENLLYDVLEQKNNFLGYKNNRFYKAKN